MAETTWGHFVLVVFRHAEPRKGPKVENGTSINRAAGDRAEGAHDVLRPTGPTKRLSANSFA